jgi:cation transport ATPase
VFDKTGTLTTGGEPRVTDATVSDEQVLAALGSKEKSWDFVYSMIYKLEEASSHPLGLAVRQYCEKVKGANLNAATPGAIEETAGRGLKGTFTNPECTAIIGNEKWIEENGASLSADQERLLQLWKTEAKSVIVFAVRVDDANHDEKTSSIRSFKVLSMFATADELRPEAKNVVASIQKHGLGTWMISGDNPTTAKAVAKSVGIPESNVIAGVLPHQKAEKIAWLQQVGMKRPLPAWKRVLGWKRRLNERCIVAMVGDGINDAPALTTADVGIAVGSGSK